MRISEHTILRDAFENSFRFMLNRLGDAGATIDFNEDTLLLAEDRCWNEFSLALEEMGVTLEEVKVGR